MCDDDVGNVPPISATTGHRPGRRDIGVSRIICDTFGVHDDKLRSEETSHTPRHYAGPFVQVVNELLQKRNAWLGAEKRYLNIGNVFTEWTVRPQPVIRLQVSCRAVGLVE